MLRSIVLALLPVVVLFGSGADHLFMKQAVPGSAAFSGTIEKLIVEKGSLDVELFLNRLNGFSGEDGGKIALHFDAQKDSFFTAMVYNDELRGVLPSGMPLVLRGSATLPGKLGTSVQQLMLESSPIGSQFELVIRDAKTGFPFFNIEGPEYGYQPVGQKLSIQTGRLRLSDDYAEDLGRKADAGMWIGNISADLSMREIEVTKVKDGEVVSDSLPADPNAGTTPGPDVVVGDVSNLQQFGTSDGEFVGLAVATDSCNYGTVDLNWFALPNNDHPVIPQNLYRMSGGINGDERFEQIGQSSVKHGFTALTQNLCGLGCNGVGGTRLGSGCSDPYSASLNAGPSLGSRAWVQPFTGSFPSGGTAGQYNANNHTGHTHTGPSHRVLTRISDLNTDQNPGASYYAEAQYITPHEYAWCQANPTQCNMFNNVSYRRYTVSGTGSPFTFSPAAGTVREKPAVSTWPGSTSVAIRPDTTGDGAALIAYKVSNPSPGLYRYEYAIYNQNLDRAIGSFSIPVTSAVTLENLGFHAPPQHPGWSFDGTFNNAGFSSVPWTAVRNDTALTWSTETFAQNPNANAIRWGTMYNFRFESDRPPQMGSATIGFFKTGDPVNVPIQVPSSPAVNVSLGGRVLTNNRGIIFAKVTLTDGINPPRITYTSSFGYYRFDNVLTGSTYTISVQKLNYSFAPQIISVSGQLTNVNFFSPRN